MARMLGLFKRKKPEGEPERKDLHFALIVADKALGKAQFTLPNDCTYFVATGKTMPDVVIPRTVLRSVVDRFYKSEPTPLEGKVRITEKRA